MDALTAGSVRRFSSSGFTLMEVLVTVVILALAAGLLLPGHLRDSVGPALTADARVLAARLRAAREGALASRTGKAVSIDLQRLTVSGPEKTADYSFATARVVTVATARGFAETGTARIVFQPDGSSSGGRIVLTAGAFRRIIGVGWLTGTIDIEDQEP